MLIDLNLKNKQVVVIGAGWEATRKVEALLGQDCEIIIVADRISDSIRKWEREGRLQCTLMIVENGEFLKNYDRLILVMAATDSRDLNRELVKSGLEMGCYVYAVDDPEVSDFSHPSVISLDDNVKVAISTSGKSPLMAGTFRQRLEPILRQTITRVDLFQVVLQERMRKLAKETLKETKRRKEFLQSLLIDPEIQSFLERGSLDEAEYFARQRLEKFTFNED
ncbi:precorrin-2 dehydrogenase/sirohydrochlorin ferrochelatase family protein [Nitrospina gracilis]|uniref:precorrin-2 dehydrogenase/sirohydrochlorin ferrochelatase family protein n=1 Tax=Nitrospina gracilis TaxID=35801 RepID=UPI001F17F7BE|nr:bifunctional precorrin-2 dehydrogenase/sirohydrochlorin ferrochelatase [Nitrospina gracilis]MCF8720599.1 precorrin-2 dehydrogenase/sirohydrochlorin ferrochelatase [Nitrospina gracilis Nb-211]